MMRADAQVEEPDAGDGRGGVGSPTLVRVVCWGGGAGAHHTGAGGRDLGLLVVCCVG